MQAYEIIFGRYRFEIPETYRALHALGHFDIPPTKDYLAFYDCEWLPLQEIAEYEFSKWSSASDGGFVPFAQTGRGEPYCWRLDWARGGEPPIVLCERCESGVCLAPDFRSFLYRMALEAFAGRNDFLGDAKVEQLYRAVDIIAPHLPDDWVRRLRDLRGGRWQRIEKHGGYLVVLPRQECDAIIAAELAFPHLNEEFIHDKDYRA
jgi:hypothetical protein